MSLRMELRKIEINQAHQKKNKKKLSQLERFAKLKEQPEKLIKAIFEKKINYELLEGSSSLYRVGQVLQGSWKHSRGTRKGFYLFLKTIIAKSGYLLINSNAKLKTVRYVYHFSNEAIRPLEHWEAPQGNSPNKLIHSLLRHLFAYYQVPRFMDQAFWKGNEQHIDWFVRMARGENLRKAPNLPMPITKKMAHFFAVEEQGKRSIDSAFIYAVIRGMKGSHELACEVLANHHIDVYQHIAFWATVFQFFINQKRLRMHQINPLMDYIHAQKFERQHRLNARNNWVEQGPPQPAFTMKGRTLSALLKGMEQWHQELGNVRQFQKIQKDKPLFWNHRGIGNFGHFEDEGDEPGEYRIEQLKSSLELFEEGRVMHHCVSSYAYACMQGGTSIWSFARVINKYTREKLLTIEMQHKSRKLVQIRGPYNARAADWQMKIIRQWANQEGLEIGKWV